MRNITTLLLILSILGITDCIRLNEPKPLTKTANPTSSNKTLIISKQKPKMYCDKETKCCQGSFYSGKENNTETHWKYCGNINLRFTTKLNDFIDIKYSVGEAKISAAFKGNEICKKDKNEKWKCGELNFDYCLNTTGYKCTNLAGLPIGSMAPLGVLNYIIETHLGLKKHVKGDAEIKTVDTKSDEIQKNRENLKIEDLYSCNKDSCAGRLNKLGKNLLDVNWNTISHQFLSDLRPHDHAYPINIEIKTNKYKFTGIFDKSSCKSKSKELWICDSNLNFSKCDEYKITEKVMKGEVAKVTEREGWKCEAKGDIPSKFIVPHKLIDRAVKYIEGDKKKSNIAQVMKTPIFPIILAILIEITSSTPVNSMTGAISGKKPTSKSSAPKSSCLIGPKSEYSTKSKLTFKHKICGHIKYTYTYADNLSKLFIKLLPSQEVTYKGEYNQKSECEVMHSKGVGIVNEKRGYICKGLKYKGCEVDITRADVALVCTGLPGLKIKDILSPQIPNILNIYKERLENTEEEKEKEEKVNTKETLREALYNDGLEEPKISKPQAQNIYIYKSKEMKCMKGGHCGGRYPGMWKKSRNPMLNYNIAWENDMEYEYEYIDLITRSTVKVVWKGGELAYSGHFVNGRECRKGNYGGEWVCWGNLVFDNCDKVKLGNIEYNTKCNNLKEKLFIPKVPPDIFQMIKIKYPHIYKLSE